MKSIFVINNKLEAITNGMFHVSMKEKMDVLEARKTELNSKLTAVTEAQPIPLHPALAEVYGEKIMAYARSLDDVKETDRKHQIQNTSV